MNFFDKISGFFSRRSDRRTVRRTVRATRYDAAENSPELQNYWRRADSRSVDASLSPERRRRLRERSRYEIANNSYALGVALTLANAVVGSGPRLQAMSSDKKRNKQIEWDFCEWAEEVRLAEKLRAMRFAKFQDGEAFAILCANPALSGPVKLDVVPIDAERVCADYNVFDPRDVDGITLDEYGNPVSYRVLTRHPGDLSGDPTRFGSDERRASGYVEDAKIYDAKDVLHWYRRTCPEQHRGAPEIAAALNLFALLKRFSLATLSAAETAADFSAVLYSDSATGATFANQSDDEDDEYCAPQPFEEIPISKNMFVAMPQDIRVEQLKAEQPTSTYAEFKREILGEIGRSLQIPVNLVIGDSSKHNYASGRLDHQEFQRAVRIEQKTCGTTIMRSIFAAWWREYALVERVAGRNDETPVVNWYWDGFEHVDPVKEANADAIMLANQTKSLEEICNKRGVDWEDMLLQIQREQDVKRKLGLTPAVAPTVDEEQNESDAESNTTAEKNDER